MKLPLLRLYLLLAWGGIVFLSITAFMPQVTEIASLDKSAYSLDNPLLPIQQPNEMPATTDPMSITVQCIDADLAITKTVASTYTGGDLLITYTITVTNKGPDLATGVRVTDSLPISLTYRGYASSQGTYSNTTGIWEVGELANNDLATLIFTTTLNSCTDSPQTISNTAYVTADQTDPNVPNFAQVDIKADYPCSIDLVVSDTVITQTIGSGLNKQMLITYTITVTNNGSGTVNSVLLTDTFSTNLTFGGYITSHGVFTFDNSTGIGIWDNFGLSGHMTATLIITTTMEACKGGGDVPNKVIVAAIDQTESSTDNNEANVDFHSRTGYCIYLPVILKNQVHLMCSRYSDDFDDDHSGWPDDYEDEDMRTDYESEEYLVHLKKPPLIVMIDSPSSTTNNIYTTTVSARWKNNNVVGYDYGLVFGRNDLPNNSEFEAYLFAVNAERQRYRLLHFIYNTNNDTISNIKCINKDTPLPSECWITDTQNISQSTETNYLTVECEPSRMAIYNNNAELWTTEDNPEFICSGGLGIEAQILDGQQNKKVLFDDFQVDCPANASSLEIVGMKSTSITPKIVLSSSIE